jgi:hypothetical protein
MLSTTNLKQNSATGEKNVLIFNQWATIQKGQALARPKKSYILFEGLWMINRRHLGLFSLAG